MNKVLFVDDEANVLEAYKRQFRKLFQVSAGQGGAEGLRILAEKGPFAVVVSDLKMPEMNGIAFLARVREAAPDTVRMMLTGYADLQTAIEAVNEGNIFRFLTKPCPPDKLAASIQAGIRQYGLVTAERELLEKTLWGSIKVLTEILSLVNPEAFGRSSRIKRIALQIAEKLGMVNIWKLETAAMLSQIGCVILPEHVLKKIYTGRQLSDEESQLYDMHPSVGHDLIKNIPRMKDVAGMIAYQEKNFDGTGIPRDAVKGEEIPLGARVLRVVVDFDVLESAGFSRREALLKLRKNAGRYDPQVFAAFEAVTGEKEGTRIVPLRLNELKSTMILAEDIRAAGGSLLVSKGQEITWPLIARLKNFSKTQQIKEPVRVIEKK
jgi:response regulator RpfG family c-di-GMP phosphodiesterase